MLRILVLLLTCAAASAWAREGEKIRNPNYGAIAYHHSSGSFGWATDRKTSRAARVEALRQCGHSKCEVVGTVRGGCAALARSGKGFKVQRGATREEAETKALRRCGEGCEIAAWTCTR